MCVEMAGRGARFAIVDLPTKAHLDEAIKIVEKMKKSDGWNVNEERFGRTLSAGRCSEFESISDVRQREFLECKRKAPICECLTKR